MDIRLLGDVEIEFDGATFGLDRAAERCVLAALAFNAGRVVPLGSLVDHVWGDHPPAKAEETVASYVRTVRRVIERAGGGREWISNRRLDGYRLDVDPGVVDHRRFVDLSSTARRLTRQADHSRAIDAFERALRQWRGEALANVTGQWAERRRHRLRWERREVVFELLDLLLHVGAPEMVAGRASDLFEEEPAERAIALAIRSLADSDQQARIPSFMTRAAERMREVSGAKLSAEIIALADKLTNSSVAEKRAVESPSRAESEVVVTMTAINSRNVYQTLGDQYFVD